MNLSYLHDWEIRGIDVDHDKKSLKIYLLEPVDNKNAVLVCNEVKRFFASGMMLQNVILDVLVFEENDSSDYLEYCKKMLNLKTVSFDSRSCIMYIEPSVGIEVACYCKSINLNVL
ncbi:hypothetical protein [Microbulbifer thermotolerans]|uniref:Uncharacterized protein n=1 Tax=Microbulbifer thermotolerans TaxID=252514 RepID=A0A143HLA1_MICTH|nr:hypothetical protein [Microbulbifer thermotolerans]AMX02297.1 hypothetical protein A3224_06605 [Microbulbifer thermotolerans]